MDIDAKIADLNAQKERRAAMIKWDSRLETLRKKGTNLKQFCDKYGFDDSHICHQKAGRRGATKEHFDAVEEALKSEGV